MAQSPTQLTLKRLREEGWSPWIVEHWNPHSRTRQDLWNFGDILAQRLDSPPLIVQTTSYGNVSARKKKILDNDDAYIWVKSGNLIEIHGWHKKPLKKGSKAMRWQVRVVSLTEFDFDF